MDFLEPQGDEGEMGAGDSGGEIVGGGRPFLNGDILSTFGKDADGQILGRRP
jgi:hypothetical protein